MLTPNFTLGCKRLLLSNTYYPALTQRNVHVVDGGLERITAKGVVGPDGVERPVDTIIYGTGFEVTDVPIAERIRDGHGRTLAEHWKGSPRAYLGTSVHGFPNLFFMIGPNLGNGHSSAFVLIEAQARYIVDALQMMDRTGVTSVEIRRSIQDRHNDAVQAALAGSVWNAGGCASYYIDRNGTNSSIYPWSTFDLRRRLRRFDAERYTLRAPSRRHVTGSRKPVKLELHGSVVAITGGARGIGLATARTFARAGAIVCIGDLDEPAAIVAAQEVGGRAYALDVSQRPSFETFIAAIERDVGPIDVLVNNAGVMPTGHFLEESDSVDAAAMAVNHFGTALGLKLVLPRMIGRGRGHVVNVASMAGRVHVPGLATYCASKHATIGLTRAVREEIEGSGVTMTTVLPGPVRTRLSDGIPLGGVHAVEPEDVARAVLESVSTRAAEVAVPKALGGFPLVSEMVPQRAMRWFRRLVRADRALTESDPTIRGDYEAEIRAQGDRLAAGRATKSLEVTAR